MDKDGFPSGNPQQDTGKLRTWWAEEMQACGLSGADTLEHAPWRSAPPSPSTGGQAFMDFVLQRSPVGSAHMYRVVIAGAPWPLEAVVVTTESGMITEIMYRAILKLPLPAGEVRIKKSLGWFSEKLEVEGPGAAAFAERKDLLKKCKANLSRRYEPPLTGFHASSKQFELGEASVTLQPDPAGAAAVVRMTVRDESAFVGRKYSLGLDKALEILNALEQTGAKGP